MTDTPQLIKVEPSLDYYAIYVRRGPKAPARFLCHIQARGGNAGAMRAARKIFTLPRGSHVVRVGREGYFRALKSTF